MNPTPNKKKSKKELLIEYRNSFSNIFNKINMTLIPLNGSVERTIKIKKPNSKLLSLLKALGASSTFEEFTLIPDFTDSSLNLSKRIYRSNETESGSYSKVYLKYYDQNNKSKILKQNIIYKEVEDSLEYNGLIFHYLLYYYYQKFPEKIQYLCKIREICTVKNTSRIYAIMDYCGNDLSKLEILNTIQDKNDGLLFIVKIFKKILESVKLIHDLGYLHLDIKPQNFLIRGNKDKFDLKIIDFGFVTKCDEKVINWKGTSDYIANDWVDNFLNKLETTLKKHHDIFSIGCTFMWLIFKFLNRYANIEMPIFLCPIVNTDTPNNSEIAKIYRGGSLYARSRYGNILSSGVNIYDLDRGLFKNYFRRSDISDKIIYQICSLISDMTNPSPPPSSQQNIGQTKVQTESRIGSIINCFTKRKSPAKVLNKDTIPGYRTHIINDATLKRVQDIIVALELLIKKSNKHSLAALPV